MGGAAWLFPRYQLIFYGVASAVLALVFFPMLHLLDVMMGLSISAMFGVVEAQVLAPMLAMIGGIAGGKIKVIAALGAAALVATVATLALPAYTAERPLALNFIAHYDLDESKAAAFASARAGSLPKAVRDQLTVGENPSPPGGAPNLASRAIAFTPPGMVDATLISDTTADDGKRTIRLQMTAPDARQVRLRIPGAANPIAVGFGGAQYALRAGPAKTYIVDVTGRAANGATLDVTLAPRPAEANDKTPPWLVQGFWTRLPGDAQSLADARPDTAVRI